MILFRNLPHLISNILKDRCLNSFHRSLSSEIHTFKAMPKSEWSEPKELHIPVAYGHIAAKAWGDMQDEPVLALHGWQDNAGTFDKLIPMLSSKLYIVAIDAPGHGLSSHKPRGAFYHFMEMVLDIRRIVSFLRWDQFSFFGHSMGGTLALMYSSLFPESVKNVVLLDIIKPASRVTDKLPGCSREGIESMLKIEKKMSDPAPVYNIEEARDRLMAGMYGEIRKESADVLLKRGCQPSSCGKGVVFSRDIRVKATEELQKLSHDDLKVFMRRICCNMLMILGKQSVVFKSRTPEVLEDFLNIYKENCKTFQIVRVEGNHFVHLNYPDRVAPHIDNFFNQPLEESPDFSTNYLDLLQELKKL